MHSAAALDIARLGVGYNVLLSALDNTCSIILHACKYNIAHVPSINKVMGAVLVNHQQGVFDLPVYFIIICNRACWNLLELMII